MTNEEIEKRIIDNNKTISKLLAENEKLFRQKGYNPPKNNYSVKKENRITIPHNYIRSKEDLIKIYNLDSIASNWVVRSNIGFAIQLSDFYNYILNRFNLWGNLEIMVYKSATINLISIFEAIILECANNICSNSSQCAKKKTCEYSFNKNQRNNYFEALTKMNQLKITDFSEEELERIQDVVDLRNRVHLRLAEEKESIDNQFTISLYNEVIELLQRLRDLVYQNGVSMYNKCT